LVSDIALHWIAKTYLHLVFFGVAKYESNRVTALKGINYINYLSQINTYFTGKIVILLENKCFGYWEKE